MPASLVARRADPATAQAVCVLAIDVGTVDVLDDLERDLGKLMIPTNQALMWQVLTTLGIGSPMAGFGWLLRSGHPDRPSLSPYP